MDFEFSDEQQQLHESIERYLKERYSFDKFRVIAASAQGWDKAVWSGLAELGVLGINVPVEYGGLGYGPLETLAMMGACGKSLVLEPVLSSAVIATTLLKAFTKSAPAAGLLETLSRGAQIAVLAHFESGARFDAQWVTTRARASGQGYVLDGHKSVVMHAGAADMLLVSAREAGGVRDTAGVSLFAIPRDTPGVTLDVYPTLDGRRAADVYLKGALLPAASRLGDAGEAFGAIDAALDVGLAALCAEAVGVMQALLDATVQYLQTRQQFGQPIGRFQALQHRVADMVVHLEQARSMSYLAALKCGDADPSGRRKALSAAKVVVGQAARFIGQQAVQLHGGMGMTDELIVSHWFKRLTAAEVMFGDSDTHLQRFAALGL